MKKTMLRIMSLIAFALIIFGQQSSYAQDVSYATLITWPEFNKAVKSLASDEEVTRVDTQDNYIEYVKKGNNFESHDYITVSTEDSPSDIFVRFEDWTLYYYTDADVIYMNSNSMQMFHSFKVLKEVDLSIFDTSNVEKMKTMFYNDTSLTTIYASELFVTDNLVSGDDGSKNMFGNASSLIWWNWTVYDSTKTNKEYARIDKEWQPWYFTAKDDPDPEPLDKTVLLPWSWFNSVIKNLSNNRDDIDYKEFIDEKIKAFKEAQSLTDEYDVAEISVRWSKDPVYVWYDNSDESIYYYTDADEIFLNSDSSWMFHQLTEIKNIDMNKFNTAEVENMQGMFNKTYELETLNLKNFKTNNVTNMVSMFNESKTLKELDLTSFDTRNVVDMRWMFNTCTNIETIYVSDDFSTDNLSNPNNRMFLWNNHLVWWNWTQFDDTNNDATYARIDKEWQSWYFTDKITIKFINMDDDSEIIKTINKWEIVDISDLIRTWYNILFYEDIEWLVEFDIEQKIEKYTEIYIKYMLWQYTITFNTNWWTDLAPITQYYWTPVIQPENPTKIWYRFIWWDREIPATMPWENITISAKWEAVNSWWNWWWSSWGGGNSNTHHDDNDQNSHWTADENLSWDSQMINSWSIQNNDESDAEKEKNSIDLKEIHKWAYDNWLTQYYNISDARLNEDLNRQEMAKISSIFAIKFYWKVPDESKKEFCSKYADLYKVEDHIKYYIAQSCELWLMWYRANWLDVLEYFRPYSPVSLAELSVIISRIMWWNKNVISEEKWYQWHLDATNKNSIIDDISNPYKNVIRWEVYNMFYKLYQLKH